MPTEGAPESEKSIPWTEDAQALLKKVPFFIRKNVEKEAEEYARANSMTKVDAGVIARVKSSKSDKPEEGAASFAQESQTEAPSEVSANGQVETASTPSRSEETARGSEGSYSRDLSNFSLFRLDPAWRKLHPTEMGHGKREFHEIVKSYSNQISVFPYCLVGLNASGDLLLWRIGTSLDVLQEMTGKLLSTFLGRYLVLEKTYNGYLTHQNTRSIFTPTKNRFIHIKPVVMNSEWHQLAPFIRSVIEKETRDVAGRFPTIRLTTMASHGLDESDFVQIMESDSSEHLVDMSNALQGTQAYRYIESSHRGITAITRSMADILDLLGG
jgi:chlorite dismutase